MSSKYVYGVNHQIPPLFHNSKILIYTLKLTNMLCSHKSKFSNFYIIKITTSYLANILSNSCKLSKMKYNP